MLTRWVNSVHFVDSLDLEFHSQQLHKQDFLVSKSDTGLLFGKQ